MEPVAGRKQHRYPGVTPFTTEQSAIFFGRRQDTGDLYRLIRRQPLVVLYGKSGLGKSSLLNAGIVPECLQEGAYTPLTIRFGAWTEGKKDTLLDIAKAALRNTSRILEQLLPDDDSLWAHAKSRQLNGGGRPLLIFDQFEELFSYPERQVAGFQQELAELLHTGIPLRFRRRLESGAAPLADAEEDRLEEPLDARIVFAIRSDRMHLLNRLKDDLPTVLRHTYELKALSPGDAEEAIVAPARVEGNFSTPPYEYSPQAVQALLGFLKDGQDGRVEGILLQMLCEHYERRQVEAHGLSLLDLPHIGDPGEVVRNYYEEKIQGLAPGQQAPARRLIEDGLVSEGEAMRLSLHEAFIAQEYGVDKALLEALVDSRLLRSEPFLRGGYTYELSHDRLVPAVVEARSARKLEELRLERQKIQRARRRNLAIGLAAILLLVFAFWQMNNARIANKDATAKTKEAKEATDKAADATKEAKRQQGLAAKSKQEAGIAIEDAAKQKGIADKATKQAQTLEQKARAAEQKAQEAQANAARATREVAEKSSSLALNLLKQADSYIYKLDYDAALENIFSAASLGVEKPAVARAFMETAFWYAETGRLDTARTLAASAARLLGREDLAGDAAKANSREGLIPVLAKIDVNHFAFLEKRYFPDFVRIPGGEFMMGSAEGDEDAYGDEFPQHQVTLSDFRMARTEVTFWQFGIYAAAKGVDMSTRGTTWGINGDHPMVNVDWYDAAKYANWLSLREEKKPFYIFGEEGGLEINWQANGYRLPTEAEWEYAAREGGKKVRFGNGKDIADPKEINFNAEEEYKTSYSVAGEYRQKTVPVGSLNSPNSLGLHDMSGNVWEWCNDWWDDYSEYSEEAQVNPTGPLGGSLRVLRGGGWLDYPQGCRVAGRSYPGPLNRLNYLGFRLVLPPDSSEE